MSQFKIPRRSFIKGAGVALGLPLLDCMWPQKALADTTTKRLVVIYIPGGYIPDNAYSITSNPEPSVLKAAFGDVRSEMSIAMNLNNPEPQNNPTNVHFDAFAALMSGHSANDPSKMVKSFDQYIAPTQKGSKFETLALNAHFKPDPYQWNPIQANQLSFKGPSQPVPVFSQPMDAFNSLFKTTDGTGSNQTLLTRKQAILDAVSGNIGRLSKKLGLEDKLRMDQYLTGIQALQNKITAQRSPASMSSCSGPAETSIAKTKIDPLLNQTYSPEALEIAAAYPDQLQSFYDILYYSLLCDLTRVGTLMHSYAGSHLFHHPFLDVQKANWHALSHYTTPSNSDGGDGAPTTGDVIADYNKILTWHYSKAANFIRRLRDTRLPSGKSLLDETLVVVTSDMGGYIHQTNAMMVYMAGTAGGVFKKNGSYSGETNVMLANLWLTIMKGFGINESGIGYSTGILSQFLA